MYHLSPAALEQDRCLSPSLLAPGAKNGAGPLETLNKDMPEERKGQTTRCEPQVHSAS